MSARNQFDPEENYSIEELKQAEALKYEGQPLRGSNFQKKKKRRKKK